MQLSQVHPKSTMRVIGFMLLVLMVSIASMTTFVVGQFGGDGGGGEAGDLMALLRTPPPEMQQDQPMMMEQQQSAQPAGLDLWQQQQAGVPAATNPSAAAPGNQPPSAAVLAQMAMTLLQAAAAQQQPQAPVARALQPPVNPFQQQVYQNPNQNLYGAQPESPAQLQQPGDVSLLAHSNEEIDTILPLARETHSSYEFDVPPADVQAKIRRAQPKPISDVDLFGRISRHVLPGQRGPASSDEHPNRVFSLEKEFREAPERYIPPPKPQRIFHLKTRHLRKSALDTQVDPQEMKRSLDENPFTTLLEASAAATPTTPAATIAEPEVDSFLSDSPAMLAFNAAQKKSTPVAVAAPTPAASAAAADTDLSMMEVSSSQGVHRRPTPLESEFAAPTDADSLAIPTSNLGSMFQSIMRARKAKAKQQQLEPHW